MILLKTIYEPSHSPDHDTQILGTIMVFNKFKCLFKLFQNKLFWANNYFIFKYWDNKQLL